MAKYRVTIVFETEESLPAAALDEVAGMCAAQIEALPNGDVDALEGLRVQVARLNSDWGEEPLEDPRVIDALERAGFRFDYTGGGSSWHLYTPVDCWVVLLPGGDDYGTPHSLHQPVDLLFFGSKDDESPDVRRFAHVVAALEWLGAR
jgi:hypothetical protein